MRKKVLSFLLVLVMLMTCSMSVFAEEEQTAGVGAFLDEENPEKIVEIFGLEKESGTSFGEVGEAYGGNGIYLEWHREDDTSFVPISITVTDNAEISYYGIGCGVEKKQADCIMQEQGWVAWGYDDTFAGYMKWTESGSYALHIVLTDGKITEWYWLNWPQGNFGALPYDDVAESDWYFDSVDHVHRNWLMTGLENRVFGPAQNLARAQFAVILHRMNEEPTMEYAETFPDVGAGVWYTDAILWANSIGVVTGYENTGNFGPADHINREQMATMMYRYAKVKGYDTSQKADFGKFSDAVYVNAFAQDAMQWAVGTGIIQGKDNGTRIDPQGNANRAECATIIMRFIEKFGQ